MRVSGQRLLGDGCAEQSCSYRSTRSGRKFLRGKPANTYGGRGQQQRKTAQRQQEEHRACDFRGNSVSNPPIVAARIQSNAGKSRKCAQLTAPNNDSAVSREQCDPWILLLIASLTETSAKVLAEAVVWLQ